MENQASSSSNVNARRKYLNMAVAAIVQEVGFDKIEKEALETLTEMLQCLLTEIGLSSKNYCEHAGRTQPVGGDVVVALIGMGISLESLTTYAKRDNRKVLPVPQQMQVQKQLNILQAGSKQPHSSYIPSHLPALPDPHAYIRTPTYKQPITEYEAIREKAANQKRDIEKALTKFLAKTSDTHSLFDTEDNQMFPLIACKPIFPSYMPALNPTDQVFDFEELEYYYQVANRKEDIPSKGKEDDDKDDDDDDMDEPKKEKEDKNDSDTNIKLENSPSAPAPDNTPSIDNPYLRPAIVPKKVKF